METTAPRFAVVDVETNGRDARRQRVVQVAVVTATADGTVLDRWSRLVAPPSGRPGPTEIHGIDHAALRDAPSFASVAAELVQRLDGAVFTAHHADFDWAFVATELYRAGYAAPDVGRLCTLRLSRATDPDRLLPHRLPDVCARHGVTLADHHHALADAEAAAALLPHLLAADTVVPTPGAWPAFRAPRGRLRRIGHWAWAWSGGYRPAGLPPRRRRRRRARRPRSVATTSGRAQPPMKEVESA